MRNAYIAINENDMQLQSQRMDQYQANKLTGQTRREQELTM